MTSRASHARRAFSRRAPIFIDDSPGITRARDASAARRLRADANIGLVVVDYLQLIQSTQTREPHAGDQSDLSLAQGPGQGAGGSVVALSQLSRATEQRTDKRPQLSDLRESGAIEQDADLVMFIYRQEMYEGPTDKDGNSLEGRAEVIVGKQRNGPTGIVNLFFHKAYTRFENYSARAQAQ